MYSEQGLLELIGPEFLHVCQLLDGVLVLHARVAADVRALGDLLEHASRSGDVDDLAVEHGAKAEVVVLAAASMNSSSRARTGSRSGKRPTRRPGR
jgi:hypothetical protein